MPRTERLLLLPPKSSSSFPPSFPFLDYASAMLPLPRSASAAMPFFYGKALLCFCARHGFLTFFWAVPPFPPGPLTPRHRFVVIELLCLSRRIVWRPFSALHHDGLCSFPLLSYRTFPCVFIGRGIRKYNLLITKCDYLLLLFLDTMILITPGMTLKVSPFPPTHARQMAATQLPFPHQQNRRVFSLMEAMISLQPPFFLLRILPHARQNASPVLPPGSYFTPQEEVLPLPARPARSFGLILCVRRPLQCFFPLHKGERR